MIRLVIAINLFLVNCFLNEKECDMMDTCKHNEEADIPVCYCDEYCLQFKDCCKEYIEINSLPTSTNYSNSQRCVDVMTRSQTNEVKVGSFMIDRCKKSGSVCDVSVGDLESITPVSSGKQTFRNSKCAICNGVDNFTYWSVLYEIPKSIEVKSFSSPTISTEKTLFKLKDVISPGQQYNLYPPNGFSPRYCSSEIFRLGQNIKDEGLYQNFALCKGKVVRNPDECINDGASLNEDGKCVPYDQVYLSTINLTFQKQSTMAPKSLQVLVQPKAKITDDERLTEDGIDGTSFTFMYKRTYIYFEIILEKSTVINSSTNIKLIEECIISSMVFLKSSTYSLTTEYSMSNIVTTNGFKYFSDMGFRSMAKLSLSELQKLLNLFVGLQYKESNGKIFAKGHLQAVPRNFTFPNRRGNRTFISITLSKVRLLTRDDTASCTNLSFFIKERMPMTTIYDVSCVGDVIEKANRGNRGYVYFLSITLAGVFFICALV